MLISISYQYKTVLILKMDVHSKIMHAKLVNVMLTLSHLTRVFQFLKIMLKWPIG